jgi:hypothetical protein
VCVVRMCTRLSWGAAIALLVRRATLSPRHMPPAVYKEDTGALPRLRPAYAPFDQLLFREMPPELQTDSEPCFNARYDSSNSNADMDGIAVSVASQSWSHYRYLPLGY